MLLTIRMLNSSIYRQQTTDIFSRKEGLMFLANRDSLHKISSHLLWNKKKIAHLLVLILYPLHAKQMSNKCCYLISLHQYVRSSRHLCVCVRGWGGRLLGVSTMHNLLMPLVFIRKEGLTFLAKLFA